MGKSLGEVWRSFSVHEKRNIAWYIGGIMFYKLGLEFFNGSITTLATDRFNAANTFEKLGLAQGLNQAAQCVGSILVAPLIRKFATRTVLSASIVFFALMTTILLIVDAATGGEIKPAGAKKPLYGSFSPDAIFIVWTLAGVAYGCVELIRRVIPADIVGGNVNKLRRMDATVHVLYEVAGTSGAFASSAAISRFGNNYSFMFSPIFFVIAGCIWTRVSVTKVTHDEADADEPGLAAVDRGSKWQNNYFFAVFYGAWLFFKSAGYGAWIVFGHRRFLWLFPGYAIALYLHRFLESSLAPAFARRVLGTSGWSQIIVGGSNFGELLGALSVFLLNDYIPTPLPWLRLDALALNIVWVLPRFSQILPPQVSSAWIVAATFIPISYGWAAGDVSLAAYIQSSLNNSPDIRPKDLSALGATMSFLYSSYIVINAVMSTMMGRIIDRVFRRDGNIYVALQQVGGIQFSVGCVIILLASLIPSGAFSLNPKVLNGQPLEGQVGDEDVMSNDKLDKSGSGSYDEEKDFDQRKIQA
ncbi:hypothetical protein OIO90_004946 [Microbotryomycetes sp. JL221]|nr:hypothetical protein OIO90_004946 [Microbotryomycetes sp. JL221]